MPAGPAGGPQAGYQTLAGSGDAELVIKKSRFVGQARPAADEAAARAVLDLVSKEHWQAGHHCYAYVVGGRGEIQRSSDGGEPSGTAGRPILETIKKEGLTGAIVVVTRYFGGILLGAGGLTRAYGQAASAAIAAAGAVRLVPHRRYAVRIGYHDHDRVLHDLREQQIQVIGTDYAGGVTVEVFVPPDGAEALAARLRDLTSGRAELEPGEEVEVRVPMARPG